STAGMIAATSHVFLLSSTTAVNVWLGSKGISERLRSLSGFLCFFGLRIDGLHRLGLTSAPMEPSLVLQSADLPHVIAPRPIASDPVSPAVPLSRLLPPP